MPDPVDRPGHYAGDVECIDAMVQTQGREAVTSFCVCNTFKYLWRWRRKDGGGDLKKARWYLDYAVRLIDQMPEYDVANNINAVLQMTDNKKTT